MPKESIYIFTNQFFGGEFEKIIRFKDISSAEFPVAEKGKQIRSCTLLANWPKHFNGQ